MKFIEAVKKVRERKFYRYVIFFVPPLFLLELSIYYVTLARAVALMPILIGFFMIPSFPVDFGSSPYGNC